MQSHQHIYLDRAPRLPSPSAWGWTKDIHGSHYGRHFVRLRTRTTSWSTVAANKAVKQDASVQLPTSHVLPYATLKETSMQTSLMTASESSSQLCVSCCNFISVQVHLLSCRDTGLRLLNWQFADFSRIPLKYISHHFIYPPPVHKVTVNTIKNIIINLLQLTNFYDFDLVPRLLWPFVQHDRQTLRFSVKNIALQWTQSKDNYKSVFQLTYFSDFDLVSDLLWPLCFCFVLFCL